MAYTMHPYSTDKGNTTKSVNDNISSIMSRMVQIAGDYARTMQAMFTIHCVAMTMLCVGTMSMTG